MNKKQDYDIYDILSRNWQNHDIKNLNYEIKS